ncbi:MAG: hypothetical protein QF707_04365 [Candidatus Poseidoniaceae archaeon]|nr:hypothetical protein [Candidatus Poseidoniaceae archaeon]
MTTMFLLGSAFIPMAQAEGSESDDNAVHVSFSNAYNHQSNTHRNVQ